MRCINKVSDKKREKKRRKRWTHVPTVSDERALVESFEIDSGVLWIVGRLVAGVVGGHGEDDAENLGREERKSRRRFGSVEIGGVSDPFGRARQSLELGEREKSVNNKECQRARLRVSSTSS